MVVALKVDSTESKFLTMVRFGMTPWQRILFFYDKELNILFAIKYFTSLFDYLQVLDSKFYPGHNSTLY